MNTLGSLTSPAKEYNMEWAPSNFDWNEFPAPRETVRSREIFTEASSARGHAERKLSDHAKE